MTKFEKLIQEAEDNGVHVYDFDLGWEELEGLYIDGNVALSTKIETSERKACILAEELGHHYTTVGNILDQNDVGNRKQERKARAWAYEKMIPLNSIKKAIKKGFCETWEIAEFLEVDEKFLKEAIKHYEEVDGDELLKWRSI